MPDFLSDPWLFNHGLSNSGPTDKGQATKQRAGNMLVAGVDEVGRGPLAGSVVAAAVILDPDHPIAGLADSKLLVASQREELDLAIREGALAFAIAEASVDEIDTLNILHASMLAMQRAVEGLVVAPEQALIDGNRCPALLMPSQAIVKGDQKVAEISAASIIAKVYRDKQMLDLHEIHPQFGFDRHKGYPTRQHFQALEEHGPLAEHRRSFAPVRIALERQLGLSAPTPKTTQKTTRKATQKTTRKASGAAKKTTAKNAGQKTSQKRATRKSGSTS